MPEIIVTDLNHVTIDGIAAGDVTSVYANSVDFPQTSPDGPRLVKTISPSAMQDALLAWRDACHCTHDETLQSQCDAHAATLADLQAKHTADLAARDAALGDAVAAEKARGASALADLQAQHTAELAKRDESAAALSTKITQLEADVAERQNMINVLGGTDLGLQMRDEAKKKELLAQKERLEAQLKELGVETSASSEPA
jgi:hypothetical protein